MKTALRPSLLALAVILFAGSSTLALSASLRYKVTDLGPHYDAVVNSSGWMAWTAYDTGGNVHAFLDNGSSVKDLGPLGGRIRAGLGINDIGWLTGSTFDAVNSESHAFRYNGSAMQDLGMLPGGAYSSGAGINASGWVTGDAANSAGYDRAFLYNGSVMLDLGILPGGTFSTGIAINASGWVTGNADTSASPGHAFLYNGSTLRDLGTLGGSYSNGLGINASGWVTGSADVSGNDHAFLYNGSVMLDLGVLPGGTSSVGKALNANGWVVGTSDSKAFVYDGTTMQELSTLLDSSGAGWALQDAQGINAAGQITGSGVIGGVSHAFLLTPVAGSATPASAPVYLYRHFLPGVRASLVP